MTKCQSNTDEANNVEGGLMSPSTFFALLFNMKVQSGEYNRDFVNCFCGSNNYTELTNKDRYNIDYTLCLCKECGLLYSNPRMTDESFERFYKYDYRNIYSDRGEIGDNLNQLCGDTHIRDYVKRLLEDFEIPFPKVVFEIGCGNGSNLKQFQDLKCIGIDYDSGSIEQGIKEGFDLRFGGIEVLEELGIKANLIIMNHVLEHMTDIERDLKRIRNLLSENGVLYVAVPGFYIKNKEALFQNAHNYQFTGNTLNYVMNCCGFSDYDLNENIESLWHKCNPSSKDLKPIDEYRSVESFLIKDKFLFPKIRMNCKFTMTERRNNIKHTVKTGAIEITPLVQIHPESDSVIISGGPSIEGYVEKIKELKKSGCKVYAIERMYQWCLKNDIVPDYVVALDASEDVIESFANLHSDVTHLIVAHAKPEVFDRLNGYKTYYFLLQQKGIDYSEIYPENEYKRLTFVNSGSSVSLCCLSIAMMLGTKNVHVFGFDCHVGSGNYSKDITGVGDIKDTVDVEIDDRTFKTTTSYFAFMQQFFELYVIGKKQNLIKGVKVYGDSMAIHASKLEENINGDQEV